MRNNEAHNQIEDIIDARNESGQYDVLCNGIKKLTLQQCTSRYAHSTPASPITDKIRDDACNCNIEGGNPDFRFLDMCSTDSIGPTDSEITLIRVKRESSQIKRAKENKWNQMHDLVIPGDGTHLGESPSLVNLVTLVVPNETNQKSQSQCNEYLVPLSSWEPKQPENTINCDNLSENISDNQCQFIYNASNTLSSNSSSPSNPLQYKQSTNSSVRKHKSIPSIKNLFKRLAFWKRKNLERMDVDADKPR